MSIYDSWWTRNALDTFWSVFLGPDMPILCSLWPVAQRSCLSNAILPQACVDCTQTLRGHLFLSFRYPSRTLYVTYDLDSILGTLPQRRFRSHTPWRPYQTLISRIYLSDWARRARFVSVRSLELLRMPAWTNEASRRWKRSGRRTPIFAGVSIRLRAFRRDTWGYAERR